MKRFSILFLLSPISSQAGHYINYPAVLKTAVVTSATALIPTTVSFFVVKKLNYDACGNSKPEPFNHLKWKGILLSDAASTITAVGINTALGQYHINPYTMGALLIGAPTFLALKPGSLSDKSKEGRFSIFENFVINYLQKPGL